jgi:hypothetical protein
MGWDGYGYGAVGEHRVHGQRCVGFFLGKLDLYVYIILLCSMLLVPSTLLIACSFDLI